MFTIIKRGANNFWHKFNNNSKEVAISDFEVVLDAVANTFVIVFKNGANVPIQSVNVSEIIVIDETDASDEEFFLNVTELRNRLVELGYTAYLSATGIQSVVAGTNVTIDNTDPANPIINASGGGGGGAVDSVNGQTGVVVLDADDIAETATKNYVTPSQKTAITHTNRSILDLISEAFTTALKTTYDDASAWVTDVGLQLKTDFDALIATGARLITNAEITKLSNTSGTNSGDNANNTTSNAYADAKVADSITNGVTTIAPSQNAVFDALALKVGQAVMTDTSATSTIVGWSSFTFRFIYEYDFGNGFVLVAYFIDGPSNSPTTSFTLLNNNISIQQKEVNVGIRSGGTISNTNGAYVINGNSNVVSFFQNNSETVFSGSGNKTIRGRFFYYKG